MHRSGEASGSARRRDGPFAPGRFRDDVGLVGQPLPRRPAGLLQGRDILGHAVRKAVRFQEQNDLLHGIELRIVGRQMQERQVGGNEKVARAKPACAVRHDYAVGTRRHSRAGRRHMLVHGRGVGPVRHVGDAAAALCAGGAQQIDLAIAMVAHDARALLSMRPDPRRHPLAHTLEAAPIAPRRVVIFRASHVLKKRIAKGLSGGRDANSAESPASGVGS